MRTIYLDCSMGAAGDMLTAALYELLEDKNEFTEIMKNAGLEGVEFRPEVMVKCGITGTHMNVLVHGHSEEEMLAHEEAHQHSHDHEHTHDHHHHHASMQDIENIIRSLKLPEKVKEDAIAVYKSIAEAESVAHGRDVSEIHFHEVGTMDAIADVTAVCVLFDLLKAGRIVASPIHVGSGHVHCAHGVLPVPAPATAYLLKGIPMYSGEIRGELCTPTGAALLKHFVNSFENMPMMQTERIGYGMGRKDFAQVNCVRAMLGESGNRKETVTELNFNIDDMSPERIGFVTEALFDAGALEVFTVPVGMKKSRPGILLVVLCNEVKKEEIIRLIFKHTSTLGIRENLMQRYVLSRTIEEVETPFGKVRKKVAEGYGTRKEKYEYEDLARIAKENKLSVEEVLKMIEK